MKPWDSYSADWDSVEAADGVFVRHEDHAADRAALVARLAELEELATEREVQLKTAWGEHAAWKARANDMSKHYQDQAARAELAESEVTRLREALAAANTLLEYARSGKGPYHSDEEYYRARDARLSAQPAASAWLTLEVTLDAETMNLLCDSLLVPKDSPVVRTTATVTFKLAGVE